MSARATAFVFVSLLAGCERVPVVVDWDPRTESVVAAVSVGGTATIEVFSPRTEVGAYAELDGEDAFEVELWEYAELPTALPFVASDINTTTGDLRRPLPTPLAGRFWAHRRGMTLPSWVRGVPAGSLLTRSTIPGAAKRECWGPPVRMKGEPNVQVREISIEVVNGVMTLFAMLDTVPTWRTVAFELSDDTTMRELEDVNLQIPGPLRYTYRLAMTRDGLEVYFGAADDDWRDPEVYVSKRNSVDVPFPIASPFAGDLTAEGDGVGDPVLFADDRTLLVKEGHVKRKPDGEPGQASTGLQVWRRATTREAFARSPFEFADFARGSLLDAQSLHLACDEKRLRFLQYEATTHGVFATDITRASPFEVGEPVRDEGLSGRVDRFVERPDCRGIYMLADIGEGYLLYFRPRAECAP